MMCPFEGGVCYMPDQDPAYKDQYSRLRNDARLRDGISAVGVGLDGRGGIHGELVHAGRVFLVAVEHFVEGDYPPGVGRPAAHVGHDACLDAALDLVVRLVVADGVDQVVPFVVVRAALVRGRLGLPDHVGTIERMGSVGARRRPAVARLGNHRRALGALAQLEWLL